ncbi:fumarylacetoacetate hydrolase family protein [Bacillus sp. OK048]|uniref:fumarylacetoacetate hydrolase family protein n=1 Tax=Bacillus sp. OK048 TaxID=1882761 RepID=UPI0008855FC3|nr:fumarylacetoacetate hydrolase family protein [Bacillus sp. OK048]SDL98150.1 2-keto-4-pentenoate hydratase/2-oxohepta-3-ene-1,7-dioic acid hydratase (catechol pathway) [Bacillus sp. OK048]
MGFHVVRYEENQTYNWGVVKGDIVIPVSGTFESLAAFLKGGVDKAREIADSGIVTGISINNLHILSPITRPAQIVCQGLNYASHRTEAGSSEKPTFNLFFTKAESSLCGPNDHVIRPEHVRLLDYEIELGLVIKKEINHSIEITEGNLLEYVAGLVITNDISARDVQIPQDQFYKGKSYRTFCPTGPYLYILDRDDIPEIFNLNLKLWVNGELRQSANTNQLIFKPEETLTELSGLMDLSPGDLVMTGTPGGVAIQLSGELIQKMSKSPEKKAEILIDEQKDNPLYLKDGDRIRCEIKSPNGFIDLGVQENLVVGSK